MAALNVITLKDALNFQFKKLNEGNQLIKIVVS